MPKGDHRTPRTIEAQIVKLYKKGGTLREVGAQTGVSRQTALRVLRDYAIPRRGRSGQRTELADIPARTRREMRKFFSAFGSVREGGQRFGLGQQILVRFLDEMGIERRTSAHRYIRERRKLKIIADYQAGLSIKQAALANQVNKATVHKLLVRRGIPRRKSGPRPKVSLRMGGQAGRPMGQKE